MAIRKLTFEELQSSRPTLDEIERIRPLPVILLLDNIRSLYNVGAIFRTADAVHLEKIVLCGISGVPPRTEIRKTSLGAEDSVPWVYFENPIDAINEFQSDYQTVALEHTSKSIDYRQPEYKFPVCLMVGHEFNGLREDLVKRSDLAIDIPMRGIKQSLNVSVACGIVLYELLTSWDKNESL